jgi:hypothetical protein
VANLGGDRVAHPLLQRQADVGQPQRVADGGDHRGRDSLRHERRFQALAETREHRVGVVTLAVEQVVDDLLEALANRLQQDGDKSSGGPRDPKVIAGVKDRPKVAHNTDIQHDNTPAQRPVDKGPIDEDVDVPGTVAQDGNHHRHGDQERFRREPRDGRASQAGVQRSPTSPSSSRTWWTSTSPCTSARRRRTPPGWLPVGRSTEPRRAEEERSARRAWHPSRHSIVRTKRTRACRDRVRERAAIVSMRSA